MTAISHADAPIYAQLVDTLGDVPGDVRRTAEEILRKLEREMTFGLPHRSHGFPVQPPR